MNTKLSAQNRLSPELQLPDVSPQGPPLPPSFPTVEELVRQAQEAEKEPRLSHVLLDLFDGVVGDLPTLLEDYFRCPQKYGEDQAQLLELLASGTVSLKQLSKSDRLVLNLAVLDFMSQDPVPEKPSVLKPSDKKEPESGEDDFDEEDYDKSEEPRTRSGVTPETELSAHWWLP